MSSDFSPEFKSELLDDFYAECDEHLSNARAQLSQLEKAAHEARDDDAALQSLYRSVHSFKGVCAIMGLPSAEALAHAAEEVLRGPTRRATSLTPPGIDGLARAVHRLEQIVTAHRLKSAEPQVTDVLEALGALSAPHASISPKPVETAEASTREPPASAPRSPTASPENSADPRTWHALFSPSPQLDQRGVNLNTVRSRLSALGEILAAVPLIGTGGSMTFDFTVAFREPPADPAAWVADGVVLRPAGATEAAEATPVAPTVPATGASHLFIAPSHIVRVDLSRLDDLMRITGEMVIHRSRLEERIARLAGDQSSLLEVNQGFGRSLRELRDAIARVRLVSVAEIFTRMPFVVRDLARETRKQVQLRLEGQETEIDKYLVERLKEPLLHLVRNAVSHGVESPDERTAAGKPAEATIRLHASVSGHSVMIRIQDDGRGIDRPRVLARAATLGIETSDAATDAELLEILCQPGFSTRDEADRSSGRGVGMAVVQNTVHDLGGSLMLATEAGRSTQFTLRLPLTLSIAETFLVSAGDQTCAVPTGFVEEVVPFAEAGVRTIQQAEVISYRDGILPLIRLRQLFRAEHSTTGRQSLLVLSTDRGLCGLVVDRIHGQREVVIRAMQDPLLQVPGVSGATELGDGRPVLILDPVALTSGAVRPRSESGHRPPARRAALAS